MLCLRRQSSLIDLFPASFDRKWLKNRRFPSFSVSSGHGQRISASGTVPGIRQIWRQQSGWQTHIPLSERQVDETGQNHRRQKNHHHWHRHLFQEIQVNLKFFFVYRHSVELVWSIWGEKSSYIFPKVEVTEAWLVLSTQWVTIRWTERKEFFVPIIPAPHSCIYLYYILWRLLFHWEIGRPWRTVNSVARKG